MAWYHGILKLGIIRSQLNFWFANFPFSTLYRYCSGLQNRSAIPECSYWCFAGGEWGLSGWPFWRHQPVGHPCQVCSHYAKRHRVAYHTGKCAYESSMMRNISCFKKKILFFLLFVVLHVRLPPTSPPPMESKVTWVYDCKGKIGDGNQELPVFPSSFLCEFFKYKCGDIKH